MDTIIIIALLLVFFGVMIGIGLYCRKHATNVDGFVLGDRAVGPWLTAFAFGTSYFSAVIFVGYAGQFGWNFGLASTWIGLGNAFIGSLLAWVVLGRRTRVMTQHLGSKTMPDFFGIRYKSPKLRTAASIIVFIFLVPYTASLYNGLSSLFQIAFDIPYAAVIIGMAALTGVYVIFGGYMATALNDFVQGIVMLFGIAAVIGAVLSDNGGFMGAIDAMLKIEGSSGVYASFFGPDPLALLFVVILTSLGTWGLPQMVGKFYSIKSEDAISKGTIISTVFAIVVAGGCYFLGGFGRLYAGSPSITYGPSGAPLYDMIIPAMLENLDTIIIGIVIVLVLSASMSTLSSLVLTSSSTLTLDVIVPMKKGEFTEKKKLLTMRIFVVFFIVLSAAIAILKDAFPSFTFIAQMMGVSWGALAGSFLAPFMYGLYWKKTTKASVAACFVWGIGITITQLLVLFGVLSFDPGTVIGYLFKSSINSGVLAMVGGLVIVPVVSLLTGGTRPDSVEDMFKCYETQITVSAKRSLKER